MKRSGIRQVGQQQKWCDVHVNGGRFWCAIFDIEKIFNLRSFMPFSAPDIHISKASLYDLQDKAL